MSPNFSSTKFVPAKCKKNPPNVLCNEFSINLTIYHQRKWFFVFVVVCVGYTRPLTSQSNLYFHSTGTPISIDGNQHLWSRKVYNFSKSLIMNASQI